MKKVLKTFSEPLARFLKPFLVSIGGIALSDLSIVIEPHSSPNPVGTLNPVKHRGSLVHFVWMLGL